MANALYDIYKTALMTASPNVSLTVNDATDGPFVSLIDTGIIAFSQAHDFYNDITTAVVGTTQRITTPTVGTIAQGIFDGDDVTFPTVSGATIEALAIYRHNSGANTTWRLVAYLDTSVSGLPVTPNGGDIKITWHASGIFKL